SIKLCNLVAHSFFNITMCTPFVMQMALRFGVESTGSFTLVHIRCLFAGSATYGPPTRYTGSWNNLSDDTASIAFLRDDQPSHSNSQIVRGVLAACACLGVTRVEPRRMSLPGRS